MNTSIEKLKERITQNYDEFRKSMLELDSETVFDLAMHIAAATDVLFYITTHNWIDDEEADYLLDFTNPLQLIADAWEECLEDGGGDFRSVLETVLNDDENEENYMTLELESELREKYGDDAGIMEALLCELIEVGNRYLELRGIYEGLGADVWGEE